GSTISVFRNLMGTTLPLSLVNFNAKADKRNSLLTWQTSSEQNTDNFIIQHSTDGTNFSDIGLVKAAGNSNSVKAYQFIHEDPKESINFYRLKMVDMDQSYTYSSVAKVEFNFERPRLYLSSNPAKDFLIVNHPSSLQSEIIIIDIAGKIIKRFSVMKYTE